MRLSNNRAIVLVRALSGLPLVRHKTMAFWKGKAISGEWIVCWVTHTGNYYSSQFHAIIRLKWCCKVEWTDPIESLRTLVVYGLWPIQPQRRSCCSIAVVALGRTLWPWRECGRRQELVWLLHTQMCSVPHFLHWTFWSNGAKRIPLIRSTTFPCSIIARHMHTRNKTSKGLFSLQLEGHCVWNHFGLSSNSISLFRSHWQSSFGPKPHLQTLSKWNTTQTLLRSICFWAATASRGLFCMESGEHAARVNAFMRSILAFEGCKQRPTKCGVLTMNRWNERFCFSGV